MKFNNKKDVILQDYDKCMKLFNINEDPNNIGTASSEKEQNEIDMEWLTDNLEVKKEENNQQ